MVPFLTPEYRKISQESGFTLQGVGINMFLKGWTPIHYNDCRHPNNTVRFIRTIRIMI